MRITLDKTIKSIPILFLLFSFPLLLKAQELQGTVMELESSRPLSQVFILNLATGIEVETTTNGSFTIPVNVNELLSFSYPGFRTDTLLVTNHEFKRIYLTALADYTVLKDVQISQLSNAELEKEIERTKEAGKSIHVFNGLSISPSRLFGKEARNARRAYNELIAEKEDRAIMAKFNPSLITSLTPLTGEDLENFIVLYKPSYRFIMNSDEEQIRLYIMDSYKEYVQNDKKQAL